jgi:glycosyltransferase involved in cell wall biosynthesis/peptidoglycan/xylan/chitin deacetylase (PgdA/CDA1 family)
MRLLFISNVFPNPYQPTKGVFNLELLRALGPEHTVHMVAPISWVDEWKARRQGAAAPGVQRCAVVEGIEVHYPRYYYPPKVWRHRYGWFFWYSIRGTVRRLLGTHQFDAVLGYWVHPDGEAAVRTARLAGVPAGVMVGGSDILLLAQERARQRAMLNVLHAADLVVTVSRDLKAKLVEMGVSAEKVHVVYRGVNTERFMPGDRLEARRRLGLPAAKPILLWVGRMVPVKGLDVLLQACTMLRDRGVDFHLHLVGDGPLRPALEAERQRRGLAEVVSFAGTRSPEQLPDWYRAADLTVLPSLSEGVPNVLRESLSCGTPCVASRVGGIPEILGDKERERAAQLVPPGDPLALAEAIIRMLSRSLSPCHLVTLSPCHPSWTQSAQELIGLLQPLVRATPRRAMIRTAPAPSRFRQLVRRLLAATLPRRLLLVRGPVSSQSLCLTFDDGPHPEHTPRLLDVLREQGVRATFFVIGKQAEAHPDLVRRMAAEGHLVGHHSFSHSEPGRTPAAQLIAEVHQTRDLLAGLVGAPPRLFRPPHGKLTARKLWGLWRAGQAVVLWNADPKDFACAGPDDLRCWFQGHPPRGGDVVLMHDNWPYAYQVLPELVAECRRRGLGFATIDEWVR